VPDTEVLTWQQLLAVAAEMVRAVDLPVIADCQTGFGGPELVRKLVVEYEARGVAAISIEDGASPHKNSLLPGLHGLAPCDAFARKIEAAAQVRANLLVLARVQALVAGCGQEEALHRASVYVDAGADVIIIHSRSPTPDEVLEFVAAWDRTTPLAIIPTKYPSITDAQICAVGKIKLAIYANYGLRAAIAGMKRAFKEILSEGTAAGTEHWIASLEEAFLLQSMSGEEDDL
jgi:phosphoenolpyruvate phosphomutase